MQDMGGEEGSTIAGSTTDEANLADTERIRGSEEITARYEEWPAR